MQFQVDANRRVMKPPRTHIKDGASRKKRVDHFNWGIAKEGPVERCPASEHSQPEGEGILTTAHKECLALPAVKLPRL